LRAKNGSWYIGATGNLPDRIKAHFYKKRYMDQMRVNDPRAPNIVNTKGEMQKACRPQFQRIVTCPKPDDLQ
jgi:predicted GIY-YIG superfamily endonuclease